MAFTSAGGMLSERIRTMCVLFKLRATSVLFRRWLPLCWNTLLLRVGRSGWRFFRGSARSEGLGLLSDDVRLLGQDGRILRKDVRIFRHDSRVFRQDGSLFRQLGRVLGHDHGR